MKIHRLGLSIGIVLGLVTFLAIGMSAVAGVISESPVDSNTNGSIEVSGTIDTDAEGLGSVSGPPQISSSLAGPPTDPDSDGKFEDLNGNGRTDFNDVVTYFEYIRSPHIMNHVSAYDFNDNGRVDFDDVVTLFEEI